MVGLFSVILVEVLLAVECGEFSCFMGINMLLQ